MSRDDDLSTPPRFNSTFSAFPSPLSSGLTKREVFAALALQGILASDKGPELASDKAAADAVECADALLEALARDPDEVA